MKKILVIRIDGIGDLLCITPMLHSLRDLFPQARIDMLANLGPHIVLKDNPDIDRLLVDYRTKVAGSRWKGLRYLPTRLGRWLHWKIGGYDLVLVAHYGIHHRAIQLARQVRTKNIVINVEPEHQAKLHDRRITFVPYAPAQHETEGVQAVLNPWTQVPPERMWLYPSQASDKSTGRPFRIGINLSSSGADRTWPQSSFCELIQTLGQEYRDVIFVVTGNIGDIQTFKKKMHSIDEQICRRVEYSFTPSLEEFINTIANCDLFISGEGGATHMAAAMQIPQIALFENKPQKLVRWRPWATPCVLLHDDGANAPVGSINLNAVLDACRTMINPLSK